MYVFYCPFKLSQNNKSPSLKIDYGVKKNTERRKTFYLRNSHRIFLLNQL